MAVVGPNGVKGNWVFQPEEPQGTHSGASPQQAQQAQGQQGDQGPPGFTQEQIDFLKQQGIELVPPGGNDGQQQTQQTQPQGAPSGQPQGDGSSQQQQGQQQSQQTQQTQQPAGDAPGQQQQQQQTQQVRQIAVGTPPDSGPPKLTEAAIANMSVEEVMKNWDSVSALINS